MGKRFVRSVLAQDEAVTASTVITYDLPVNALSHILFTLKCLNDTGTITNYRLFARILSMVSKIEVLYKGQAIWSGSLRDICMLGWLLTGKQPWGGNYIKTDNDVRFSTVLLPMGRRLLDPEEAFPPSRKGELQLQVTYAAAQTGFDAVVAQIETVEMLEVQPKQFLKATTMAKTPGATGFHDMDLPIGNPLLGVLLFSTTVPTGASYNASVGQVKMLLDNVEHGYSFANWESLHGEIFHRGGHLELAEHTHRNNQATAGTEDNTGIQQYDDAYLQHYAYLDYDPHRDGSWALETAGHSRVNLRINAEPTADEIRVMPVELIRVGGGI